MRAIQLGSPFPPVPDSISKGVLSISSTFRYQARPKDVIKSAREQSSVTLDATDFPYEWYLRQVLQKVEERWQTQNRSSEPAQKPRIYVEIQRDGSIAPPRAKRGQQPLRQ